MHCTALHCTTLHCTAMHCTTLHYTALHWTALHCTALQCTALNCTALYCTALHYTALHCTALLFENYMAFHCPALQFNTKFWPALHYTTLWPAIAGADTGPQARLWRLWEESVISSRDVSTLLLLHITPSYSYSYCSFILLLHILHKIGLKTWTVEYSFKIRDSFEGPYWLFLNMSILGMSQRKCIECRLWKYMHIPPQKCGTHNTYDLSAL